MRYPAAHTLFTVVLSLLLSFYTNQSRASSCLSNVVTISGRVEGASEKDTLSIEFKKEFVYGSIGAEMQYSSCDNEGYFSFTFKIDHIAMVSLFINNGNSIIFYRYIEPGDCINCFITQSQNNYTVKYSGQGSTKFNCMAALEQKRTEINEKTYSKVPPGLFSNDSLLNALAAAFCQLDETADELFVVLQAYKNKISSEMMNVLTADIIGEAGRDKCFLIPYFLQKADTKQRMNIKRLFINRAYLKTGNLAGSAVYSDNYIEFLYRRCQQQLALKNEKGNSMNELYELLSKQYAGFIRDRVLTSYLLREHAGTDNNEYQSCLQKAINTTTTALFKNYLVKQFERTSTGVPAFDFLLPGIDGKLVSLNELKGKIVFVDFWFTGCSACKELAKSLENIVIPNFNDSEVVFVSICLDKNKAQWLSSLKKGGYSSEKSINLFTDGSAFDHPLVKHYNIQGCPALLLIDKKSKIISVNPPREPIDLIKEINKALKL